MKIIRDLSDFPDQLRGGAVAIGNFDGVHRGHARIVERLIAKATEVGGPAIVFSFDPHPVRLLRPEETPPPLTWTERKAVLLVELGVDWMIAYPTDQALLNLSAQDFFQQIVCQKLGAKAMVEGPNFFFGHDRTGNVELLQELTTAAQIQLDIVEPCQEDGQIVSSSRVRKLIAQGDVQAAAGMLTRAYRIRGMVTHGAGRGLTIGFPTANVDAIDTLLPGPGVYAGRAYVDQNPWPAAINIGPNPTFGENVLKVEVHLIGYTETLYGQPLEVDFLKRIREIQPFPSVVALKTQLAQDVEKAKLIASQDSA